MTSRFDALKFVEERGIVLASAKGPIPSVAEAIAGRGSIAAWELVGDTDPTRGKPMNTLRLAGAVIELIGIGLFWYPSMFMTTSQTPGISFNPRDWFRRAPKAERETWFKPGGWRIHYLGMVVWMIGIALFYIPPFIQKHLAVR